MTLNNPLAGFNVYHLLLTIGVLILTLNVFSYTQYELDPEEKTAITAVKIPDYRIFNMWDGVLANRTLSSQHNTSGGEKTQGHHPNVTGVSMSPNNQNANLSIKSQILGGHSVPEPFVN